MKKLLFSIGTVFLFYSLNAQIIVEQIDPGLIGSDLQTCLESAPVIEMPEFNYKWIEEEEEKDTNVLSVKPPRFGYAYETEINNSNDGKWTQEGNISIWTLSIKSKDALSINLIFDEFFLSVGSEFYIYNDAKTMRFGPVTSKHNKLNRKLSTDIIKGSSITLILIEPNTIENTKSIISVKYVIHGYTTACDFGEAILGCHYNASCNTGILADEKYAVARILVWCNTRCCSGTLINNACNCPDYTPYFLTAFHCIDYNEDRILNPSSPDEDGDPETWAFSFKYISPACYPSSEPSSWISYTGAVFRAYNDETDFLLVEMDDQPEGNTGLTYAGWSRNNDFPFQDQGGRSLHHPAGDVMKQSIDNDEAEVNEDPVRFYYYYPDVYFDMAPGTLWEVDFDYGAIEGGSSGGALFDPNDRIIGQAVGSTIPPQCFPSPGFYGRLSESWARSQNNNEQLAHWLDPDNTGAMTTNTVGIPYISGPSFVCYSPNATFTLHNRPSGTTVNWTYNTSLLNYISGQGTNTFTVKAKTQYVKGVGWVKATISKGSCDPLSFQKNDFWVGRFQNTVVTGQAAVCPNTTYLYTAIVPYGNPSSYSYEWTYPSNWSKIDKIDNKIWLRTPSNPYYGTVSVSIENDCGWSDYSGITVYPGYCGGGGGYYMALPNPADSYIDIEIDEEKITAEGLSLETECFLTIVDNMGMVKYTAEIREYPFKINTSKLPDGLYIINLLCDGKISSIRVMIEH